MTRRLLCVALALAFGAVVRALPFRGARLRRRAASCSCSRTASGAGERRGGLRPSRGSPPPAAPSRRRSLPIPSRAPPAPPCSAPASARSPRSSGRGARRSRAWAPAARSPSRPPSGTCTFPGASASAPVASRLEEWLRAQPGPFLLVAAVGGEPGPAPGPAASRDAGRLSSRPRCRASRSPTSASPIARAARCGRPRGPSPPGSARRPPTSSAPSRRTGSSPLSSPSSSAPPRAPRWSSSATRRPTAGRHGLLTRPDALFDDTLRSTLVVATPGLSRPGQASSRLVSTLDAAPTLLALAGLAAEPGLAGRSLMPLLADPRAEGRRGGGLVGGAEGGPRGPQRALSPLALHGVARRQPRALRPRRGPRRDHEPRVSPRAPRDDRGDGPRARAASAGAPRPGAGRLRPGATCS